MVILGFDTSVAHCAVAVWAKTAVVAVAHEAMAKGQAERLMPLMEETLAQAGLGWQDLDAVAVGIGPGNFTGIRISVSAARGLGLALKIPVVGVSSFEVLRPTSGSGTLALKGPRGHVYVQDYDDHGLVGPPRMTEDSADNGPVLPGAAFADALVGRAAVMLASGKDLPAPKPLYIKPADAALPRQPPPKILT